MKQDRRAFTLIELLVVVGVIAILAGILLPALALARKKGRQSMCGSNLKEIGIAVEVYRNNWDGYYPPASNEANDLRWMGRQVGGVYDRTLGPLYPYLKNKGKVDRCPSFVQYLTGTGLADEGTGGYGYNSQYVGGSPAGWPEMLNPARGSNIASPSATVMFADTAITHNYTPTGTIKEYPFCEAPRNVAWAFDLTPSTHFRHNATANNLFCDGHARALPSVKSTSGATDFSRVKLGFVSTDNSLYDRE